MPAQRWMRWVFCDKRSEKRKRPTAPSSLMFEALSERASPMSMTGTGSSPSNAEGFNDYGPWHLRPGLPLTWRSPISGLQANSVSLPNPRIQPSAVRDNVE